MPRRNTPPREVNFSAKPTPPGQSGRSTGRGRILQLHVNTASGLTNRPEPYASNAGEAPPSPFIRDASGATNAPATSQRAQEEHSGTENTQRQPASELAVQTLITSAVSGWCAVMYERAVYSLHIAPMGGGAFEVEAIMALPGQPGVESNDPRDHVYLRVNAGLGVGKLVRTEAQPLAPSRGV